MRRVGAVIAVMMILTLSWSTAGAGVRRWTSNGPYGGRVQALTSHPTDAAVMIAGTHGGGIFRTSDGGRSWTRANNGLPRDTAVFDIEYARSNPNVVYAVTYSNGVVHKSVDGGRSWTRPGRYPYGSAFAVAVAPDDPNDVWVAGDELFHSTDGGGSWEEVRPYEAAFGADDVTFAPSDPDVVYVVGDSVQHSTDGGRTWSGTAQFWDSSHSVVVHPTKPAVVYVGVGYEVYKSADFGESFTSVLELPSILDEAISLAINPARPGTVYAGTQYSGVYRITSGGAAAARWNRGVPAIRVPALAVSASGQTVFAGLEDHAVYRRGVDGTSWRSSREGVLGSTVLDLATPPSGGSHVYAATQEQGVALSTDGGASWRWRGLYGKTVEGIAVHPHDARIAYAAAVGLFKTTDAGATWRKVHNVVPRDGYEDVAISPSAPRVVYAATFDSGVYRSGDGGRSWRRWSLPEYKVPFSVAVHPRRPNTAFAGTRFEGVVKTTDGGRTWKAGSGIPVFFDTQDIAIDPRKPRRMYAAVEGAGVYRSLDGGVTWRPSWRGEEPTDARAIEIDQRHPWRVFAAAGPWEERPGVFRSNDYGRTWERMNDGLNPRGSVALALSASGVKLHAATAVFTGGGVFTYRFR